MKTFDNNQLKKLYKPPSNSMGEQNGQVTIIGGSKLFHGAPLFSLKIASRFNDMVFFATPEPSVGRVAEIMKSKLMNFIWIDWADTESYIEKSDAVLIGPGFMRFGSEKTNEDEKDNLSHQEGILTKLITETFLKKFPNKKWVIDAGSLQVIDTAWIPDDSVITPNKKEFEILFNEKLNGLSVSKLEEIVVEKAKRHKCIIVLKGPETFISDGNRALVVKGGNPGLTKGGTGDALAGLTVALLAKNDAYLAASAASYIAKRAADDLYENVGVNYNADDLCDQVPVTLQRLLK